MPWYWYGELESSENRLDLARGVKILHSVELHGVDENLTDSWTPGAKDFLPKKKKFQPKPKKAKKKPCSESQQNTGKRKGGERSKTTITERNDDFEMAMAMSVTEEIERVRQAENDRESEELAKVLSISLHEVSRESVNNDDGMGVTNQVLTDR